MRLLVVTQAVDRNDQALGFFHDWLDALAERVEELTVICLYEGEHDLPANVVVRSLGKEKGSASRFSYARRFLAYAWQLRGTYDGVLVHMNPEYVVLAGWLWKISGKRVVLWYTHRKVSLTLRTAVLFADVVATAAPESLGIGTRKRRVLGHGIDTARFAATRGGTLRVPPKVISVGRITSIKRLEVLLDAVAELAREGRTLDVTLIGDPVLPADHAYAEKLRARAGNLGIASSVVFEGTRPYAQMPDIYRSADISINLAPTGGIDKAVLESMASGAVPLVANEAFRPLLAEDADALMFTDSAELAARLRALLAMDTGIRAALISRLQTRAREDADVGRIVARILALFA